MNMILIVMVIVMVITGGLAINLSLFERKLKVQIEQQIKSLDKEDFNIIKETKIGVVKVYPDSSKIHGDGVELVNRKLDLDGNIKFGIDVPFHSIHFFNDDCKADEWNRAISINSILRISEHQYNEYIDMIKGCDIVSTNSFYLEIELVNTDVISLINKWNKYYGDCYIFTKYMFERYNVLNLITDMQTFSDDEIDDLINKIKNRIIERLNQK